MGVALRTESGDEYVLRRRGGNAFRMTRSKSSSARRSQQQAWSPTTPYHEGLDGQEPRLNYAPFGSAPVLAKGSVRLQADRPPLL
jgi:hypothetical protein